MKLHLPISPRFVWPIAGALLALDVTLVTFVSLALYRTAERVRTFQVDGMTCRSYAPTLLGDVYLVARCSPVSGAMTEVPRG